jgi:hypothetical protein
MGLVPPEDPACVEDLVPLGYQKLRITRILHF